jgi:cytochrome P450
LRNDITDISMAEMTPLQRALIAYEGNHELDTECPMTAIGRIAAETPVIRWDMGVALFTMADIVAAGNHPALVSANPVTHEPFGMGSSEPLIPLHLDGELHRHYRKLLDPLFAPKRMTVLEDRFRELTDDIIDRFIDDAQVDFYREFAAVLPGTMFMQLFGAPMEDFQFYVEMKDRILEADGDMETRERRGREAGDLLRARLRELIDRRRADDTAHDDLIAAFMTLEIDGHRLSDDDIVNVMHLFVIAGLDTVTSSISLMISWLARHPDERRILIDDPSRVAPMVEELMRYESPVPSSGVRWAIEDTEINGIPVKQGDMVYLCWAAGNLDPAVFDDPHEVKLDRQGNRHIGFAAGRHRCLGSHLARLELRCAIDQWHRRVSDYEIVPGEQPSYVFDGVRSAKRLPLAFTKR